MRLRRRALLARAGRCGGTRRDPRHCHRRGSFAARAGSESLLWESSLRDLAPNVRASAFDDGCLRREYRAPVDFVRHDARDGVPGGPFDLTLCRNLVFTYFADELQLEVGRHLVRSLRAGGTLIVGAHETVPEGLKGLEAWPGARGVYRYRRRRETENADDRRP
jgi:chemotaxis protein methyltransferase CheR